MISIEKVDGEWPEWAIYAYCGYCGEAMEEAA